MQRARAYAAGRMVLAFENTDAVARYGANQTIVFGEDIDPDAAIAALDAVTYDEVREVAAGVADNLAVACVGPTRRRRVLKACTRVTPQRRRARSACRSWRHRPRSPLAQTARQAP